MADHSERNIVQKALHCDLCRSSLPLEPRPIFQFSSRAKILLIGQAPGLAAHSTGKPWDDKSGERLREWLNVSEKQFYDPEVFAIIPMGLCYPGKGKSGDLPPRKECAPKWMPLFLSLLKEVKCQIYVGKYACDYMEDKKENLTTRVRNQLGLPNDKIYLPHPSPRNNIWLSKNRWFEQAALPQIKKKVSFILNAEKT